MSSPWEGWNDGAGATEPVQKAFFRLCSAAQQIVEAPADADIRHRHAGSVGVASFTPSCVPADAIYAVSFKLRMRCLQVLLLQAVLTALQQDLDARMTVFCAASAAATQSEAARPVSRAMQVVLEHSHLWRLLPGSTAVPRHAN